MLRNPSVELLRALRRLAGSSPDFQAFMAYLEQERHELSVVGSLARDQWTVGQAQGAVQTLDKLKQLIEISRKL
jgi:hypothetical protein